jgi:predicted Zn-ribbon and HTH transcriptional regulator
MVFLENQPTKPMTDAQLRARDLREIAEARTRLEALEQQVARLKLLNEALWQLIKEKVGISEDDLYQRAQEIDAQDGRRDGQLSSQPLRCPECGRISQSRHGRCLYCGLLFDKKPFDV